MIEIQLNQPDEQWIRDIASDIASDIVCYRSKAGLLRDLLLILQRNKISLNTAGDLVQGDVDNWLPIETAPRDGSEILVVRRYCGWRLIAIWHGSDSWFETGVGYFDDATHWQPLPEAPK